MLVLTRKPNETIIIDGGIEITVLEVTGNKVRLGIKAPPAVKILRQELAIAPDASVDGDGGKEVRRTA